jgi:hypothetical protein
MVQRWSQTCREKYCYGSITNAKMPSGDSYEGDSHQGAANLAELAQIDFRANRKEQDDHAVFSQQVQDLRRGSINLRTE